jgi:hypothetical protein
MPRSQLGEEIRRVVGDSFRQGELQASARAESLDERGWRHARFPGDRRQRQLGRTESAHQSRCRIEDLLIGGFSRAWTHRLHLLDCF